MPDKPTREALRTAQAFAKLWDLLQKEWTAIVVIIRKPKVKP